MYDYNVLVLLFLLPLFEFCKLRTHFTCCCLVILVGGPTLMQTRNIYYNLALYINAGLQPTDGQ